MGKRTVGGGEIHAPFAGAVGWRIQGGAERADFRIVGAGRAHAVKPGPGPIAVPGAMGEAGEPQLGVIVAGGDLEGGEKRRPGGGRLSGRREHEAQLHPGVGVARVCLQNRFQGVAGGREITGHARAPRHGQATRHINRGDALDDGRRQFGKHAGRTR